MGLRRRAQRVEREDLHDGPGRQRDAASLGCGDLRAGDSFIGADPAGQTVLIVQGAQHANAGASQGAARPVRVDLPELAGCDELGCLKALVGGILGVRRVAEGGNHESAGGGESETPGSRVTAVSSQII